MANVFPIEMELCDGRFVIAERIRGEAARGLYRGYDDGFPLPSSVLVTIGTRQRRDRSELEEALALELPGVPALRHIGPLGDYDLLVEDEPPGAPATELARPLSPREAPPIADALAVLLEQLHQAGAVLGHLRPELLYLDRSRTGRLSLSGVVVRPEIFLATASRPCHPVAPLFTGCYLSPELIAWESGTPASDVFSLAAVLCDLLSGQHPFEGDDPGSQMLAIHAGARRPWTGPAHLAGAFDRALSLDAGRRPPLREFVAELAA
jgi:serine/threonine protein kinase